MLYHYSMKNLHRLHDPTSRARLADMHADLGGSPRVAEWSTWGTIDAKSDLDQLREDNRTRPSEQLEGYPSTLRRLWQRYPLDKQRHAMRCCARC
jgi:hypothetical protein